MISKFDGFIEANLRDAHWVSTNFRLFISDLVPSSGPFNSGTVPVFL